MQVKVLISDILQLQCALSSKAAPFYGPAFLEQAAAGVNDFLVRAATGWTIISLRESQRHHGAEMRQHGARPLAGAAR
jgi:hypothetical protein